MSHSFEEILQEMEAKANSKSAKGTLFEEFMQRFLTVQPPYSTMYENVWLWSEFPYNGGKHDFGIDLVAKKKDFDEYVAIQCKFYSEDNSVSKADVDTFLSASGKPFDVSGKEMRFIERIIISTTDKWSSTAEDTISGQKPPVNRIRLRDFKESGIDWEKFSLNDLSTMKISKKTIRPHQKLALSDVLSGFQTADRGKLIMACGTGKTYTALKIMEAMTQGKGNVLFLVPSISLLNQTLVEWTAQCAYPNRVYAVCSDPKASKNDDNPNRVSDTIIPATTKIDALIAHYQTATADQQLNLFFSTYQSIEVISQFQKASGVEFDLVICDEAHRTTGVTLAGEDESAFVRVHDNDYIKAKKRLYMTATPRIYGEDSKEKANQASAVLCSMDDESIYGKELHRLGFGDAVEQGLLSDYKVLILTVDEGYVNRALQKLLTDENSELKLDDAVRILGCLNGLSKRSILEGEESYFANDPTPMKRAVAFSSSIKNSQRFVHLFSEIQDELKMSGHDDSLVSVSLDHVDGKTNVLYRKRRIEWLKESIPDGECRVLSNARCLSEGIDVPALDAVMFLNPRRSMVDIIQSVGRVMRKSPDKKFGYIILPIGVPAGISPEQALNSNERFKIVWDVLRALRAHDDRLNDMINRIDLNKKPIDSIFVDHVTDSDNSGERQLSLPMGLLQEWKDKIFAKIVEKCGDRRYWETWAKDIADIANRHIEEIKLLIKQPEIAPKFKEFLEALRANLNSSIKQADAIEMLAEHMITKPVFDALFENYEFIKSNPVSIIMQDMLDILDEKALDKEQETLNKFYASVQQRAKGIDNSEGKQRVVIELYEQFFKNALPKQVAKLGIVYTPVEVVNFILQSVEAVLQDKFGSSINDDGVHILDPFTGTGTFIVQLLRSGLIRPDRLLYKYTNEIHANEIVLLAYYIACVNIEETFHDIAQSAEYVPFEGIVLTDTFAMTERQKQKETEGAGQMIGLFSENSARANRQLGKPITVIIGNPPYSAGQKSGNDNNQNTKYPFLDSRVEETYAAKTDATLKKNLYNTLVKAFRWASDRLGENGVIAFVTSCGYIDGDSFAGFRACLLSEFNSIYVFNLRGNQNTKGEESRREGGKIFGVGSRTPIAILVLVKKKGAKHDRFIRYHDIGDYLDRNQKLSIIEQFRDIRGIDWQIITPNECHDWVSQRDMNTFYKFIVLGTKGGKDKQEKQSIYLNGNFPIGISTNRDPWVYSFSHDAAKQHAESMIAFYNAERERCHRELAIQIESGIISRTDQNAIETFLTNLRSNNPQRISWSRGLSNSFCRNTPVIPELMIKTVAYRPFCKKYLAFNRSIIEMPSRWDSVFPTESTENLVIGVSNKSNSFSVLMTNTIQSLDMIKGTQSFPLYIFDREDEKQDEGFLGSLIESSPDNAPKYKRRFALSDVALTKFQDMYGRKVTKEDIFYYVYAVLQCKQYIANYGESLAKKMPRIPMLEGFFEYVKIGRQLAELHLGYERVVDPESLGLKVTITKEDYSVTKMRFAKEGKENKKDTILFNSYITISNIPLRAYDYIINGWSAIEWVMDQYQVKTDTRTGSGLIDDPNTYGDEKYIFNLLISIIDLSIRTQDLLDTLPEYKEI